MFTGIVEKIGIVRSLRWQKDNLMLVIESPISKYLKPDQSVAHNGVCLTITKATKKTHTVTAVKETLQRTNLDNLKTGDAVNLERAVKMNSRLEGHIVQGHVDCTSKILQITDKNGSKELKIELQKKYWPFVVSKGSICINGISLTLTKLGKKFFKVVIIPHTLEHTNLKSARKGNLVNIEFDILGKYIMHIVKS